MAEKQRNHGLDVVRSIAIISVLLCHFHWMVQGNAALLEASRQIWWVFPMLGYYGVDLFFVLSGFLLGKLLITTFIVNQDNSERGLLLKLGNFYMRRWFRTLPLYYLILSIYVVIYSVEGTVWSNIYHLTYFPWTHYIFWQGIGQFKQSDLGFFSVSWSLAVEEWFYVLFPILIILFYHIAAGIVPRLRQRCAFPALLCIFLSAALLGRFIIGRAANFDPDIEKDTFLRLDSIGIGVLFAYLLAFEKKLFSMSARLPSFVIAICVLAFVGGVYAYFSAVELSRTALHAPAFTGFAKVLTFNIHGWNSSLFAKTILLDLVSFCLGIVVCFFYNAQLRRRRFFAYTSAQSYSIYLIHVPVCQFFSSLIAAQSSVLRISMMTCLVVFTVAWLSYLFYRFCEKPIMEMRDKAYFPFSGGRVTPI
jgi:peptidoglycan/LPS O-acetylase OafA/YrhL